MSSGHGHDQKGHTDHADGGHEEHAEHEEHEEDEHEEKEEHEDKHEDHSEHKSAHKEEHKVEVKTPSVKVTVAKKKISELDLITLILVAVIGRILLEPFPSVEPIIPIAVYAGLRYGADAGILVGLISYPLSNIFMEGGPLGLWSFLQAIGGAIAGAIAGYAPKLTKGNLVNYTIIGTIIFELALNIPDQELLIWPFSIIHIVSNIIIALVVGELVIKEK